MCSTPKDVDADPAVQPRRSQRASELAVASPWVTLQAYRRKKRGASPADQFWVYVRIETWSCVLCFGAHVLCNNQYFLLN